MKEAQRQSVTSLRLECIVGSRPDYPPAANMADRSSAIIERVLGHPTHGFLDRVETPALPGQQQKPVSRNHFPFVE